MNLELLLSKIFIVLVPFGTFMIIVKYKEKVSHTYKDDQLEMIEKYLIDYFSLTEEEITFEIHDVCFTLKPDCYPVETIGNINVYQNDYPFGSLAQYFLNDQKYAYDLYESLAHKCKSLKVPMKERYSYTSMFVALNQYLNVKDTTIKESLFQLKNILTILVNEKRMQQQYYRYVMILFEILQRYQKLESVDVINQNTCDRTRKVVQKVVRILSEKAYERNIEG